MRKGKGMEDTSAERVQKAANGVLDVPNDAGGEEEKIQWHPAFRQAMRAELAEYARRLTFIDEHPLTTEPLRLDLLIIKKPRNVFIKKNIGRIFRGHNIIEYKSPDDTFSAADYSKLFAYTYLYASLAHISPDDTTMTIVSSRHPRSLLRLLRSDPRLAVEESGGGILYISGERMPVQIIEQKALSMEENLWLASLRKDLGRSALKRVIGESSLQGGDLGAYVYAVLEANEKTLNRGEDAKVGNLAKKLNQNPAFVREFMKLGYGNLVESAKKLLKSGVSVDIVASSLGLPLTRVEELMAELDKELVGQAQDT